ncbi:hypothetical protein [Burkholderia sp. BC1]|uniref:hypothetical protein n=1 Tax=Burkholderia sp. BC1 TaxID=1095370 RepID=UPI004043CB81
MPPLIFALMIAAGGLAMYLTQSVATKPEFAKFLESYSPWLGSHAVNIGYAATALVCVATMMLPWILAHRDHDGKLEEVQNTLIGGALEVLRYVAIALCVVSIVNLFGLTFLAAKHFFQ